MIRLKSLIQDLKRQQEDQLLQIRTAEDQGLSDKVLQLLLRSQMNETSMMLERLSENSDSNFVHKSQSPLQSDYFRSRIPIFSSPQLSSDDISSPHKVFGDLENLSLQLRCNLVTEDRPHMGRCYLQSFIGQDAISWLEKNADVEQLNFLGKLGRNLNVDELSQHSTSHFSSPASSRSNSRSPSPSPSASSRRNREGTGLGRSEALWVANEWLRTGEWQQLTGYTSAPERLSHTTPCVEPVGIEATLTRCKSSGLTARQAGPSDTKNWGIAQPPLQIQASSGALPDIRGGFKHVPRVRL